MSTVIKRIGVVLGGIIGLLLVVVLVLSLVGRGRLSQAHDIAVADIEIPTDAESIAQGQHLVESVSACVGCHQPNFEGEVFMDAMPIGRVIAPNLTSGSGGIGGNYSDADWILAIRHGVGADGRALLPMMPSRQYSGLSDEDLGKMVAYLKQLPATDTSWGETQLAFTGNIIMGVFAADTLPVAVIDHEAARVAPAAEVTAEYGRYLTTVGACAECHGEGLSGGRTDPNAPIGPNLTPGGELQGWDEADFIKLMREGVKPTGTAIDPFMPWDKYGGMTDIELQAIWLHLSTMPAAASTTP